METWHPLGPAVVISAFNFPVAVWAWNAALALVCGDTVLWKPSEKTPLSALAMQRSARAGRRTASGSARGSHQRRGPGGPTRRACCSTSRRCRSSPPPASTAHGTSRAPRRLRRVSCARILELGGNNAAIVAPSADLPSPSVPSLFAAVGTAGQRCTSLRRLFVERSVYAAAAGATAARLREGERRQPAEGGHAGRPADRSAGFQECRRRSHALAPTRSGCTGGERVLEREHPDAFYVRPALVAMRTQTDIVLEETFAPILYVHALRHARPGDRAAQRVASGPVVRRSSPMICARRKRFLSRRGLRLRHRQRQHRYLGRRDRRRVRRREGHRRRPRVRLRCVEGVHAARDQHDQLLARAAARAGDPVRGRVGIQR